MLTISPHSLASHRATVLPACKQRCWSIPSKPSLTSCLAYQRRRLFSPVEDDREQDSVHQDINPSADSSTSNSRQTGPAAADAARVAAGKQEEIDDEEEGQDDDDNQFRESTVHVGFTGPDPTTGLTAVRYIAPGVKLPPRDKLRIHVLYDLDNLHPDFAPPEQLVQALRRVLGQLGSVASVHAVGNETTFKWTPPALIHANRLEKGLRLVESSNQGSKKGSTKSSPYRCELCGQYQRTADALTRHFKQVHEREFKKRTSIHAPKKAREKVLKDSQYMDRYHSARRAAGVGTTTRSGKPRPLRLELGGLLKKEGVKVTAVPEKPQAADTVINRSARDLLAQHQQWQARRQRQALRGQQQQEQEQGSGNGDEGVVESQDGSTQRDDEEQERGGQMSQPPEAPPQADHQQPALCIISDDRGFKSILAQAHALTLAGLPSYSFCTVAALGHTIPGARPPLTHPVVSRDMQSIMAQAQEAGWVTISVCGERVLAPSPVSRSMRSSKGGAPLPHELEALSGALARRWSKKKSKADALGPENQRSSDDSDSHIITQEQRQQAALQAAELLAVATSAAAGRAEALQAAPLGSLPLGGPGKRGGGGRKSFAPLLQSGAAELKKAVGSMIGAGALAALQSLPAVGSYPGAQVTIDFRAIQALAVGMVQEAGMVVAEEVPLMQEEEYEEGPEDWEEDVFGWA